MRYLHGQGTSQTLINPTQVSADGPPCIQFCPRTVDAIVPPLINLQNYEPTPRHLPPPIPVSTASGLEDFSDVKPGIMELIQEEQRVSAQLCMF